MGMRIWSSVVRCKAWAEHYIPLTLPLAPTGSGKTVLFELAIIRMLQQAQTRGQESKCIYVAPTKVNTLEGHL